MRRIVMAGVMLALVACGGPPAPRTTPEPAPAPSAPTEQPASGSARVTASSLNVRSEATADATVVTRVRRGTKLEIIAEREGWLKVRLASGETGWVSSQHVSRGDAPTATSRRRGANCPADSDYSFTKTPVPAFSDRGAHGLVVVEATVNTSGEVKSTKVVLNTTEDEGLAALAEREIRSARFRAPVRNCVPREFIFTYKRSF